MLILGAGGLLVAALVIWALTRTVEPAASTPVADATSGAVSTTEAPALSTQPGAVASDPSAPVAAQAPPPRPDGDPRSVKRIAVEDLRAKLNRGEVTVIDVRDPRAYATRHIQGSLNIPFASIEAQLDQIPKDKPIVTYCT